MLSTYRLFKTSLFFSLTLLVHLAHAENAASLAKAIKIYKSGYEACVEGHSIRGSNLKAAKEKISFYMQKLEEAKAVDGRIMTTTEQNIDRNLDLCKTARDDILRAEAFPIMEKALAECNQAKALLNDNNIASAEASFKKYSSLKSQAFAITTSLDKQADTKAGIRRCEKTGEKLQLAKSQIAAVEKTAKAQNQKASQALKLCKSGQGLFKASNINTSTIANAKSQLTKSQTSLNGVGFNLQTASNSSEYGLQPIHKTVQKTIAETKKCQASLKTNIAQKEKILADQVAAKNAAKLAAAKKAQQDKLAKEKASQELAAKQEAERIKREKELAEKKKLDALSLEQEKKRKLALEKAEQIKKQKKERKELKQNKSKDKKTASNKAQKDWRTLVNEKDAKEIDIDKDDKKNSSSRNKKDWTTLVPK